MSENKEKLEFFILKVCILKILSCFFLPLLFPHQPNERLKPTYLKHRLSQFPSVIATLIWDTWLIDPWFSSCDNGKEGILSDRPIIRNKFLQSWSQTSGASFTWLSSSLQGISVLNGIPQSVCSNDTEHRRNHSPEDYGKETASKQRKKSGTFQK